MTLDQLRIVAERTRAEAKLNGSIQRIQLDNQMLVSYSAHLCLATGVGLSAVSSGVAHIRLLHTTSHIYGNNYHAGLF